MSEDRYDVVEALEALGIKRITKRGNEVNFSCPQDFHARGDKNPSASVNSDNYTYHCFSCGASGTLYSLVGDVLGVSPAIAIRWLREGYWEADNSGREKSVVKNLQHMLNDKVEPDQEPKWLDESVLDQFNVDWFRAYEAYIDGQLPAPLAKVFEKYNLLPATLTKYQIGYCRDRNRITIPRRNVEGKLIEIKGRSALSDENPRYLGLGNREGVDKYNFPRIKDTGLVYGLDSATPDLILCEGEFVSVYMRQLSFTGSVAVGTSEISEKQLRNILKKAERATILFDFDKAGLKGANKAIDLLYSDIPVKVALLKENTEPEQHRLDEMQQIIKNAKTPLEFKKFYKEYKSNTRK